MGNTFVLPIFSSLLNTVKMLGNIGGSIFIFQLAAKLLCAYMCPYWPRPGQNTLPHATAALVREEVDRILHERGCALHNLQPVRRKQDVITAALQRSLSFQAIDLQPLLSQVVIWVEEAALKGN